jgi:hypothetical protein
MALQEPWPSYRAPISGDTWRSLIDANRFAVREGWAAEGVFAPGIGPEYRPAAPESLLYVGKSAGPRGSLVGSKYDQLKSSDASTRWMISFANRSPFWQFVDKLDPTRRRIAWTNVCKMDRLGGGRPPRGAQWRRIASACVAALREEINALAPRALIFATSHDYKVEITELLNALGYRPEPDSLGDPWTSLLTGPNGTFAVQTKHPERWKTLDRDRVNDWVRNLLSIRQ